MQIKFLDTTISEYQPPVYNVNKIEDCIMELHEYLNGAPCLGKIC
jgi:hypothetical protein